MMHLQKLNRNYNGYHYFTHRVEFLGQPEIRIRQWISLRNWLWGRFGPSAEQNLARADNFDGTQPKWAWDSEKSAIYLKEEALTEFILIKERWQ
jgi:hypothetical protein